MANSVTHAGLPYPIWGCRYTIAVPYLDSTGTPTDPTTPDTERSRDGGAFADCTEEVTTITGSNGMGYITLTGDETNCSLLAVAAKVASGPKTTLAILNPRSFPIVLSSTAQAGGSLTITLNSGASSIDGFYIGCIVRTRGGTGGGGGSGNLNNQARVITGYTGSTKVADVFPAWETNPDATTTFEVLLTEMSALRYADVKQFGGTNGTFSSGIPQASLTTAANTAIATEIMGTVAENNGSYTVKGIFRIALAALAGRTSVSGASATFKSPDNVKTRISATTDGTNSRTAITLDTTD